MRVIPAPLQTHIQQEVLSLSRCIKITKTDGTILRLTTHDVPLTVGGDVYTASVPIEVSAIQSTDSLSVDNAEMTLGIDGTYIKQEELDGGLFDNAAFELFLVNWEDTSQGVIALKRGTLGDIEIENELSARVQLRGLTQVLQRPIVERYSPTCRVALGGKKCGVVNIPTRVRRPNQKVRTFDWFLVPSANITTPSLTNLDFESPSLTTGWTIPGGSAWTRTNTFAAFDGTYYAEGGAGAQGSEHVIYRDLDTTTIGMVAANVDSGDYSIDVSVQIAATSSVNINSGRVFIEQFNALGQTLRRDETDSVIPEYQVWQGIGLTAFVLPNCRTLRVGFINRIDEGAAGHVAFDAATIRFFTNELSTWGSRSFRTMKVPSYPASERKINGVFNTPVGNTNSSGAISGWTISSSSDYWRVVTSNGGLSPQSGAAYLLGGDNGTTTPNSVYSIHSSYTIAGATPANIAGGWYYAELRGYVAKTDADSAPRLVIQFLNSSGGVIASADSGYLTSLTEDTWTFASVSSRVPANTTQIRALLYARSGAAGSAANAAFDNIQLYFAPTAYEAPSDAEYGKLSATLPTYDYDLNDYTKDGQVVVQARALVFDYAAVTGVTNNRVIAATGISATASDLYSGKIVWLSGPNAGRVSYIRIWDNTTKTAKLYDSLLATPQIGDKFVYAKGCDKTIDRCADTFGNAHNFRGEPYLPGPSKVIEFLTTE